MLKFVGSFDKLKDYGFIITQKDKYTYDEIGFEAVYESEDIFNPYKIIIHDRDIYFRVIQDETFAHEYEDINADILYDLIKDGLVIKVDDTK